MKLNLIMPMGGGGTRFGKQGYELPKPLIKIYDKPFFYWATQSIVKFVDIESLTFVVLQEHVDKYNIKNAIYEYYSNARINVIPEILPGAVLTCMEGVKNISSDVPILFNDCDHLFTCEEFYQFCKEEKFDNIDGGLLTFKSRDAKFSFVAYDENGYVNRTVEKEVISEDAICGAYYFRNRDIFEQSTQVYLKNCAYNEFFVSGVYNVMASQKKKIVTFKTDKHVSFGTPIEYEEAQRDKTYLMLQ